MLTENSDQRYSPSPFPRTGRPITLRIPRPAPGTHLEQFPVASVAVLAADRFLTEFTIR